MPHIGIHMQKTNSKLIIICPNSQLLAASENPSMKAEEIFPLTSLSFTK